MLYFNAPFDVSRLTFVAKWIPERKLARLTPSEYREKLNELVMRSLLELDTHTERYKLHNLTRAFLCAHQKKYVIPIFRVRFLDY